MNHEQIDKLRAAIDKLLKQIKGFMADGSENPLPDDFYYKYEVWYTRARRVVAQVVPERLGDFEGCYIAPASRKEISALNYTLGDALRGLQRSGFGGVPAFDHRNAAVLLLLRQHGILEAARAMLGSMLADIRGVIRTEMATSELDGAEMLRKSGHFRASGVVAGVVLEAHLKSVAVGRGIEIRKKRPTISDYNDALKASSVVDVPMWRLIQRLGDIRNLCGHPKDRDPKDDEVDDLVRGARKVLAEVG